MVIISNKSIAEIIKPAGLQNRLFVMRGEVRVKEVEVKI